MSVISALFDNKVYNFEQAFGVKDITSAAMRQAIREWYALYYDTEPTEQEDPGQRLPVAVVSKLTRTAFSEYTAQVSGQSSKSAFLAGVLTGLDRARKAAMQQALIGGEAMLKPLPSQKGTGFTVIGRNNYLVLGRNEFDEITDIGTAEVTDVGRVRYTLLERRTVDAAGYLTIESRLFRSDNTGYLGYEVPLPSLDKYAALERLNRLPQPVWSAGLISLKMPIENTVDGSPDGVSVYPGVYFACEYNGASNHSSRKDCFVDFRNDIRKVKRVRGTAVQRNRCHRWSRRSCKKSRKIISIL